MSEIENKSKQTDNRLPGFIDWIKNLGRRWGEWRDQKAREKLIATIDRSANRQREQNEAFKALNHLQEKENKPTPKCVKCGIPHMREGKDECSKCSGWACPHCGRGKTPEQAVCNRPVCKTKETIRLKKEEKSRTKMNPNEVVRKFYR